MYTFCFVNLIISSLSIPYLSSADLSDRAMISAVSVTMLEDWVGMRKYKKLEGESI